MNTILSRPIQTRASWVKLFFILAASSLAIGCANLDRKTALDKYVAAPDPSYQYKLINTIPGDSHTTYVLEMTSQEWLSTNEVDRPLWKHWLLIVKPQTVASSKSLLLISGGSNDKLPPKSVDSHLVRIALETKSIVAELKLVPNQPLTFAGDNKPRHEDEMIAYTWDKFLRTGDEKWPARLPMTKSAVRAMDAVQSFCASPSCGSVAVDSFVVAGGSKRGWTTWTTAAVDKRVVAIVPIVIDLLNLEPSFTHHFKAYGFWAPAIQDYTDLNIMDWTGTPQFRALMKIEEPFEYRQRLTMPKFIINSTGDQFFLPDSAQFYFDQLSGVKYLRYVPNTDHSLRDSDAWQTLLACYHAVVTGAELPRFTWTHQEDGSIRVQTIDTPSEVKLWQAANPNARDFRLETIGPVWKSVNLSDQGNGIFVAQAPKSDKGWAAFFVELTFPSTGPAPFKFTTEVWVVPDTLPYTYKGK